MHDDILSTRRAIAALAPSKHLRRYPAALAAQIAAVVRAHPEIGAGAMARQLDMAPQTLERIARSAMATLVPVRVVADSRQPSGLRVHGPRGIVVEGLDLDGVAALVRALT